MKKLIILLLVIISLQSQAQTKDSIPPLTDSTALIRAVDYDDFINEVVMEMPAKYADQIRQWWARRLQILITERNKRK